MKDKKKIGKKLLNNWALKLFSLVAAFLLWLVVMDIENPEDRKTFNNIPVRLVNTDVLTNENMVYEVLDKTDTVRSVTIIAKKSIRDELNASDIVAEADFSKLTVTNTVEIRFYSLRYNEEISSITGSNEILKLNIEEKRTKRLTLTVDTTGEVVEGYMVNAVVPDQNRVEISGPESVVSKISSAVVKVDISDSVSDISTYSNVILYDVDGNVIASDNVSLNVASVRVRVEILQTKTVPVRCEVSGTPAAGYMFTGELECEPESITIAGTEEALADIREIVIPEDAINITGQTDDMRVNINVEDYLPEGIILASGTSHARVSVTAHIEREASRDLTIASERIRIAGIPAGYQAELNEEEPLYTLSIKGMKEAVDAVNEETLYGHVNIADYMEEGNIGELSPGVYEMEVEFMLSENITIVRPLKVSVRITETTE